MMDRDQPPQRSLFYSGINLDKRVRSEHVLRKVSPLVDFGSRESYFARPAYSYCTGQFGLSLSKNLFWATTRFIFDIRGGSTRQAHLPKNPITSVDHDNPGILGKLALVARVSPRGSTIGLLRLNYLVECFQLPLQV